MVDNPFIEETLDADLRMELYDRRVIIALDLGSDSSTCWVSDSREGFEERSEKLDLQHFAKALTAEPSLLFEGLEVSKGIRSRFTFNPEVEGLKPFSETTTSTQGVAVARLLAPEESRREIVDFSRFRQSGVVSTLGFSPIGFFASKQSGFRLKDSLLNSKLAFMAALSPKIDIKNIGEISAAELLQMQVGLILENFVRNHPWWTVGNRPKLQWKDVSIVLTVPNTYSPLHALTLQKLVNDVFPEAFVTTLSESDAVVNHLFKESGATFRTESGEELIVNVLMIDIGRGTTDASLISNYYDYDPLRLTDLVRHQQILARAGAPLGGAYLSFQIVSFVENFVESLIGTPDRGRVFPMTKADEARATNQFYTMYLADLDAYVDTLKKSWTEVDGVVSFPEIHIPEDLAFRLTGLTLLFMGKLKGEAALHATAKLNEVNSAEFQAIADSEDGKKLFRVFQQLPAIIRDLQIDLNNRKSPPKAKSLSVQSPMNADKFPKEVWESGLVGWQDLVVRIQQYIHTNLDDMVRRIAADLPGGESITIQSSLYECADLIDEKFTEVIGKQNNHGFESVFILGLAGQASLFKPLRERAQKMALEMGLQDKDSIIAQSGVSEGSIISDGIEWLKKLVRGDKAAASPNPSLEPRASRPEASDSLIPETPIGNELKHSAWRYLPLLPENCKSACVEGAMIWAQTLPVTANSDQLFGYIHASSGTGRAFKPISLVDIKKAQGDGVALADVTEHGPKVSTSWTFRYIPNRLNCYDKNGEVVTDSNTYTKYPSVSVRIASEVTLKVGTTHADIGVPIVEYDRQFQKPGAVVQKEKRVIGIGLAGYSEDNKGLYALLWPARLADL